MVLMLCGTRWLAEFQRRVRKDRSSRRERERESEGKAQRKRDTYRHKGIYDKEVLDKITLKQKQ